MLVFPTWHNTIDSPFLISYRLPLSRATFYYLNYSHGIMFLCVCIAFLSYMAKLLIEEWHGISLSSYLILHYPLSHVALWLP